MKSMNKTRGFTLVELLIVIVVIAILAAITLVAYNGIQTRARIATNQSDLSNIGRVLNSNFITNDNTLPNTYESSPELDKIKRDLGALSNRITWGDDFDPTFNEGSETKKGNYYIYGVGDSEWYELRVHYYDYERSSWWLASYYSDVDYGQNFNPEMLDPYLISPGSTNSCHEDILEDCLRGGVTAA